MTDSTMTNQLQMRWLPVTDAAGRTHLEAVWITDPATTGQHVTHAA